MLCIMMNSLRLYSPKKVNGYVQPLITYLGLDASEVAFLSISKPHGFVPERNNCHLNVWCQLRELGGSAQHGWQIAHDPRHKFSEAIFHTVWKTDRGALMDITPRADGEKVIMFVPDHNRSIALVPDSGSPAINSFSNVKVLAGQVVEPLRSIQIVMQSDFAQRHGLWPW